MAKKKIIKGIHIDPDLAALVEELAKELGVTQSQIYQYFVVAGLIDVKEGKSGIWGRRTPSASLNYDYNIDIDDLKKALGIDD